MNIQQTLETLIRYYVDNRANGYSTTLSNGMRHTVATVLLLTSNVRKDIPKKSNVKNVSLRSLDRLRGQRAPLMIDNDALLEILIAASKRIEELEFDLAEAESPL
jgi:hypothetical protein